MIVELYSLAATGLLFGGIFAFAANFVLAPRHALAVGMAGSAALLAAGPGVGPFDLAASLLVPYPATLFISSGCYIAYLLGGHEPSFSRAEWAVFVAGLATFYALSLGLIRWDPYSLGYHAPYAVATAAMVLVYAIRRRNVALALAPPLSLLVWSYQLNGSENYFDALYHPILLISGLAVLPARLRRRRSRSAPEAP